MVSSHVRSPVPSKDSSSFNLVIEVLMVSSLTLHDDCSANLPSFQSRNRGSYGFKLLAVFFGKAFLTWFQSRNRGSYGFKAMWSCLAWRVQSGFQSRNRGSYGFKPLREAVTLESLGLPFQSRNRGSYGFKCVC